MATRNGMHRAEALPPALSRSADRKAAGASKIGNLPNDIREQLNLRLLEGETGRELAAWLNALPVVQSILSSHFNGSAISEVNLTHWRQGGYLQWLTERECFDSARALAEGDCDLAKTGLSAERLLNMLTLRFGQLLMRWDTSPEEGVSETVAFIQMARKARILQGISRAVLAIHRIQSKRSNTAHSLTKSEPLATAPMAPSAFASKLPLAPRPAAAQNGDSDGAPKPAGLSSAPLVSASHSVPGLASAASTQLRAQRGRPAGRPEMPSEPVAPASILSSLSNTPFRPDIAPGEILNAV